MIIGKSLVWINIYKVFAENAGSIDDILLHCWFENFLPNNACGDISGPLESLDLKMQNNNWESFKILVNIKLLCSQ